MNQGINKKIRYAWYSVIFLYLFFLTTTISNAGTSISMGCSIFLTGYMYCKQKIKVELPDKNFIYPYFFFFCCLFLATIAIRDWKSLHSVWKYFTWTIPFWIFYYTGRAQFHSSIYWYATVSANFLLSGYAIYLFFLLPLGTRIQGFSSSPNLYAMRIELILPYLFLGLLWAKNKFYSKSGFHGKIKVLFLFLSFLAGLIALFMTQSRGACAGVLLGLLFVLFVKAVQCNQISLKKRLVATAIMAGVLCSGFYMYFHDFSRHYDYERVLLWKSSYNMWQDHKVFGVGYSNWQYEYRHKYISPEAKEPDLPMPHNVIIFFFSTTGLVGGFGYLILVIKEVEVLIKYMNQEPDNLFYPSMLWAFSSITIHGMVDAGITNRFAMQVLFAYIGICLSETHTHHARLLKSDC